MLKPTTVHLAARRRVDRLGFIATTLEGEMLMKKLLLVFLVVRSAVPDRYVYVGPSVTMSRA